jgi:hypothetical protein
MSEIAAAQQLTPEHLIAAYEAYKSTKRQGRGTVASANWPSVLAHECRAYAAWNRIVPVANRRKISSELAMLFDEGIEQERIVRHDLENAGFEITENQGQMTWQKYEISGRKDFKIWKPGFAEKVTAELKSCGDYAYNKLNKAEDLLDSPSEWFRKWARQVCCYLVLEGLNRYWLLLKSKSRGGLKCIEFVMNDRVLETAEVMLKTAEWVNGLIKIGGLPTQDDKLADSDVCANCEFFDTCLPELDFGPGAVIFGEEDVAEMSIMLERRAELEPLKKEFTDIDEDLKSTIKSAGSGGQTQFVIGSWTASIKEIQKKEYTVKAHGEKHVKFLKMEAAT